MRIYGSQLACINLFVGLFRARGTRDGREREEVGCCERRKARLGLIDRAESGRGLCIDNKRLCITYLES